MHLPEDLDALTDEQLLRICKADEKSTQKCIEVLIRRHYKHLYNYIRRMLGNIEMTEDIVQETFLRVFRNARRYKRIAKFTTWMFRIATNLAFNEIRRRKAHPTSELDAELDDETRLQEVLSSDAELPLKGLERKELEEAVEETLEHLPPDCRAVLLLCDMEDLSYETVGDMLNLKPGTVGSRLCRARRLFISYFTRRFKHLRR